MHLSSTPSTNIAKKKNNNNCRIYFTKPYDTSKIIDSNLIIE